MPLKITIATVGTRGDVQPYVALGLGLQAAGHQVQIATDPLFQNFIENHGLGFVGVAADPRQAMQEDIRQIGGNPVRLLRWIDRQFTPLARQYFTDMRAAAQDSDAILVSALAFAAMHVAQALGIPSLATYLYPITPTRAFPSMAASNLPRRLSNIGWVNWLSFRLYNLVFFRMMLPVVNQLRQEILDLPPIPWSYYTKIDISDVPIIYGYSQHVLPKPVDWGNHLHVTGYWFIPDEDYQPPIELTDFIDGGSKPVYIGFGSMLDAEAAHTTQIVLEALQMTGGRAILHGGWSDFGAQELPDNVFKTGEVPHSWLFPRVAAVIHHGGAGTTAAGLRAGVPSVIVPYFADQPFWARHVHQLAAGPAPIPRLKLSAKKLAAAIQKAAYDEQIQKTANQLGEQIRGENGVAQAVDKIDSYVQQPQQLMRFNP
jgi:UDP:flavonoid glycosyltransferase YjiC (YdhE family)